MFWQITKVNTTIEHKRKLPICSFCTFIDVRANWMCPLSSPSYITTAVKSSWIVDARSLRITNIWVLALISIITRSAIKGPPYEGRALAAIGPWCVDASGRWKTLMGAKKTLVSVLTRIRQIAPIISRGANACLQRAWITSTVAMGPTNFTFHTRACCNVIVGK